MIRDLLQKKLREMEKENPSPNLNEWYMEPTFEEKNYFLFRGLQEIPEKIKERYEGIREGLENLWDGLKEEIDDLKIYKLENYIEFNILERIGDIVEQKLIESAPKLEVCISKDENFLEKYGDGMPSFLKKVIEKRINRGNLRLRRLDNEFAGRVWAPDYYRTSFDQCK